MTKYKVDVAPADVVVTGAGTAGIKNEELATYLVRDADSALEDMASLFGKISVNDIKISSDGTIMIGTDEFAKIARDTINNPVTPVAGWGCMNTGCLAF